MQLQENLCHKKKLFLIDQALAQWKFSLKVIKFFLYDIFVGRIIIHAETKVCVMITFLTTDVNFVASKVR